MRQMQDSKAAQKRAEVREYTEPLLTTDEYAVKYAEVAQEFNALASARGWTGVPATLHAALYDTRHGEQDIEAALVALREVTKALANGLISLRLVKRMRESVPILLCPKCRAMPLADDGVSKVLCERCDQWYDVMTGEPCEALP